MGESSGGLVAIISAAWRGREVLEHLEAMRVELAWVIDTFPEPYALWVPAPEQWSAHQTLAHLRDTERQGFAERVRRVIQEEEPFLPDFPGGEWAARWRPEGALRDTLSEYLAASRASDARLAGISELAWERGGVHPDFGRLTLLGWVERMHFHLIDHLGQILAIRAELHTRGLLHSGQPSNGGAG
jgi:hypothetical protein